MSSKPDVRDVLRRLKPDRRSTALEYRNRDELTFVETLRTPLPKLLLDTTVYIDELQGRLPEAAEIAIRAAGIWHSAVTEAELSALAGLLNPRHPGTAQAIKQIAATIEQRSDHRITTPDRAVWLEAGVLAGLLARLQGFSKRDQRRALNDALILLSASKAGCTVLTRNISDFDLLTQLAPWASAIFYNRDE